MTVHPVGPRARVGTPRRATRRRSCARARDRGRSAAACRGSRVRRAPAARRRGTRGHATTPAVTTTMRTHDRTRSAWCASARRRQPVIAAPTITGDAQCCGDESVAHVGLHQERRDQDADRQCPRLGAAIDQATNTSSTNGSTVMTGFQTSRKNCAPRARTAARIRKRVSEHEGRPPRRFGDERDADQRDGVEGERGEARLAPCCP